MVDNAKLDLKADSKASEADENCGFDLNDEIDTLCISSKPRNSADDESPSPEMVVVTDRNLSVNSGISPASGDRIEVLQNEQNTVYPGIVSSESSDSRIAIRYNNVDTETTDMITLQFNYSQPVIANSDNLPLY